LLLLLVLLQVSQGLAAGAAKDKVWLVPATLQHSFGPELHANACVVQLLTAFSGKS
jgi:hypothetical protein